VSPPCVTRTRPPDPLTAHAQTNGTDEGPVDLSAAGDSIDISTFDQILEMDEEEDEREFSKGIVYDFFTQAESTFEKMDAGL
jgi:osomolarity two-component system, phosphorelay intermediate protein YPD1